MDACVSFSAWMPYTLGVVLLIGVLIGFALRAGIDYAEIAGYRRLARPDP